MYTENALSRVIAGSIKRNEHLENILLVFFESLPLSTAPKDGTSILVYPPTWPSNKAAIAHWYEDSLAKKPRPFWNRCDDLGQVTRSRAYPPTHWMPLPEPPEGE